MKKRTKGAWVINHTNKLVEIKDTYEFEDIELAGKCGVFLSNLAASDEQSNLELDKVNAIAKVSNIKKTEIETIKSKLKEARLIDTASNGSISVLGVTTSAVLGHTSDIFDNNSPSSFQKAALELSDNISDLPKGEKTLNEYISDTYSLSNTETKDLFLQAEEIGFIDYEVLDDKSKLYFNGNLFRREGAQKTNAVLSSLKPDETRKIVELDQLLTSHGCITLEKGKEILGEQLLSKLQSIGMYDFNEVSNSSEAKTFITKPSAFSKYGNPFEEDALDLAKAFVSSLYYGINFSSQGRGKISMLEVLLRKLVNGREVGPATAIGEDYKLLELKRVIQLRRDSTYPNRYHMKLLKKDIGLLAMQVLELGDATEQTILGSNIYTGSVTNYIGPENKRQINRKKQNSQSKKSVGELLRTFRN
ncbi:hypothetical protein [Sphingobacterium hungaricum]|uniref:Uncharacterized protein n=1 Tax=Sphingobacterium hungaricum TaxID=2082723 RepID=A0A928UXF7_9SPHI|nr:hypothetical protein [Sphingobacterium hungaricum]MBE8714788.1 hypothetical protein [Sphingobacterium hungaricum]